MNKKCTTAKELCGHFEVSQRTIYRDIETLCQAGIPIYTTKGKGGGIGLLDNFVLNKSVLSEQEQNVILSALQSLRATTYPESDQVLNKLSSLFGNKNPDWIEVDFSYWSNGEEGKQKFAQLKEAILDRKIIRFDYFNSYGQESHRSAEPAKLVFKGQAWYLYAYCREKKDYRYFKVTRIRNLAHTDENFIALPPADGKSESAPVISQTEIPVALKVDSEMAYRIYDEFPAQAILRNEDGSFIIHAKLMSGGWLYGYLMSYEDYLEILEPEELREEIKNRLRNLNKIYKI
jgi:predicted DNA-binding transcriptional regulator YafY